MRIWNVTLLCDADTARVFGFGQFKGYFTLNFWNPVGRFSVLDNSLSDESGNLLSMVLDLGAEEHSGFWFVWSLGRHEENSVRVRSSSLFALKRHDATDYGAKWILRVDEPRTQWERISHSGISVWVKNSDGNFGYLVQMLTWK